MKAGIAFIVLLGLCAPDTRAAQPAAGADPGYPTRPIRLVVPQAPGGSNDIMARYVGLQLGERLRRQVVVDNRPGAEGMIGTDLVAKASPDGYTLLMASAAFTQNPAVRLKLPYDPIKDFDWAAMLGSGAVVVTVSPSLAIGSLQDLVALGKAKPGFLTAASAGGFNHFVTALFKNLSGVDMVIALYKGGFPALIDVMGGQAHLAVPTLVTALPHIRSGKLRPLATGGTKRAAALPELPTISEAGVPGYDAGIWWAFATPAGTPTAVIARLNAEVQAVLRLPETQQRFVQEGAEVWPLTPAEIRKLIPQDIEKWAKVARDAGMKKQ